MLLFQLSTLAKWHFRHPSVIFCRSFVSPLTFSRAFILTIMIILFPLYDIRLNPAKLSAYAFLLARKQNLLTASPHSLLAPTCCAPVYQLSLYPLWGASHLLPPLKTFQAPWASGEHPFTQNLCCNGKKWQLEYRSVLTHVQHFWVFGKFLEQRQYKYTWLNDFLTHGVTGADIYNSWQQDQCWFLAFNCSLTMRHLY